MEETLKLILEKISNMDNNMQEMKGKINTIDDRLTSLEQNMVRMEDKMDTKLSALFDGYKQNTEQIQDLKKELSSQEEFIIKRVK